MTVEEYFKQHNLNQDDFNSDQMREIQEGLKDNLDVSKYAHPKFASAQMYEIRGGLKDNLDISKYADPKYHSYQMEEIRGGLEEGLDVSVYAKPEFKGQEMEKIRQSLEDPNNYYCRDCELAFKQNECVCCGRKLLFDKTDVKKIDSLIESIENSMDETQELQEKLMNFIEPTLGVEKVNSIGDTDCGEETKELLETGLFDIGAK